MTHPALIEIIALHNFFEDWFNARLPKTETAYARFASAIAPGFALVDPGGEERARGPLLDGLWNAHGKNMGVRIHIENALLLHEEGDLMLARYDECQRDAQGSTRRLSSVWFKRDASAPAGLLWLRVHETWGKP